MASVTILTEPITDVEYSITDGHVRSFVLLGVKLYDEADGTAVDGWKDRLVELVREYELDVDRSGIGLHAFVYRMQEDGLLTPNVEFSGGAPLHGAASAGTQG